MKDAYVLVLTEGVWKKAKIESLLSTQFTATIVDSIGNEHFYFLFYRDEGDTWRYINADD